MHNLGDGYYFVEYDDYYKAIIYCFNDCEKSGVSAVPPTVVKFYDDDNWILAKSYSRENGYLYWIVKRAQIDIIEYDAGITDLIKDGIYGPMNASDLVHYARSFGVGDDMVDKLLR